jgi:sensor domain CHASE-containing protein
MPPIGEIVFDELISDGIVIGAIDSSSNKSYAVFSTTVDDTQESRNFLFLVPLTVLAWKRIGFGSIVVFVGSANMWYEDTAVRFVFSQVRQLNAIAVFLEPRPENAVMISQVK